jgi:hypothetical protein
MKRLVFFTCFVVLALFSSQASAQEKDIVNFHWNGSIQNDDLAKNYTFNSGFYFLGFGIDYQHYISRIISIGLSTSFDDVYNSNAEHIKPSLNSKDDFTFIGYKKDYLNLIPVMGVIRFSFNTRKENPISSKYYYPYSRPRSFVIPYIGLGIGGIFAKQLSYTAAFEDKDFHMHFGLSPEVGVIVPFGKTNNWAGSAAFKYNWASSSSTYQSFSWLNINVGISYIW